MIRTYSPRWAEHVTATYEDPALDQDTGLMTTEVRMKCSKCGGTFQVLCTSRQPRAHVINFAVAHFHGDMTR